MEMTGQLSLLYFNESTTVNILSVPIILRAFRNESKCVDSEVRITGLPGILIEIRDSLVGANHE